MRSGDISRSRKAGSVGVISAARSALAVETHRQVALEWPHRVVLVCFRQGLLFSAGVVFARRGCVSIRVCQKTAGRSRRFYLTQNSHAPRSKTTRGETSRATNKCRNKNVNTLKVLFSSSNFVWGGGHGCEYVFSAVRAMAGDGRQGAEE